jgi:Zn-dependent protease with chaperone function
VLLCGLCVYWWLLFPGHIALAIGAWWAFGVFLALSRYAWRRWALAEAVLQTKDYRLFGRRTGRSVKRTKHDRASLYVLSEDSAFRRYTVMVLATDEPDVYVSSAVRSRLEPDQLRALIAHELGHSWSQHHVGCEVGEWVRRMFLVPFLGWLVSILLAVAPVQMKPILVFAFLTALALIWKINGWVADLLNRPIELGADLYAVEMTRTPEAFVEGMRRLAEFEPYNVFPNLFDVLGFCSHPCIVKRLERIAAALEAAGEELGARGRRKGANS